MKPTHIIIHHSESADHGTLDKDDIRRWHTQGNKWSDIGYNLVIEQVEDDIEVILGRMPDRVGAHCVDGGMNHTSLGVCLVGNFDLTPPPQDQWDKAVEVVSSYCRLLLIPAENVRGHREYSDKTCPGLLFDLDKFRAEIDRRL